MTLDSYLFPGRDWKEQFSKILKQLLAAHEKELAELDNDIWLIGTHRSMCKWTVSYMASVPGGTPAASICIHEDGPWGK